MSEPNLHRAEIKDTNGEAIHLVYDEGEDILDIFFGKNEPATGVELTDHILLRLDQKTGRAISLTLLHFSVLTEQTEYGPRSYPLDKLEELPEELAELVVRMLTTVPLNQYLKLSYFQQSPSRHILLTYVEPSHFISVV